jgi:hypothetical protein
MRVSVGDGLAHPPPALDVTHPAARRFPYHGGGMKARNVMLVAAAATAFGMAGCGSDVASQLQSNEQLRTQVLDTLASHRDLALKAVDRLMATDSLRSAVVDQVLRNEEGAKQVLVRIGTNPDAVDIVLGVAMKDSTVRGHVMTLLKGMQLADRR